MKKKPAEKKIGKTGKTVKNSSTEKELQRRKVQSESGIGSNSSFRPDALKIDLVRQTLITVLWKKEELTYPVLVDEIKKEVGRHFNGDIESYIRKVSSDLKERKLFEEVPGKDPLHYRLSQKLDSKDEDESATTEPEGNDSK